MGATWSEIAQFAEILRPDVLVRSDIQNREDFKTGKQIMGKLLLETYFIILYLVYN
jgi:hypothetical protein